MFLPLELTLRPSRIYVMVLAVAHGLAFIAVWMASLSVWSQAALTALLLTSMIWLWRENSSGPNGLRVTQSGHVEILDTEWRPAELKGQSVVLPWFASLVLVPKDGKQKRIMIWPDSIHVDDFRKLRVWLRWGKFP